jgi:hypothetical protein
MGRLTVGDRGGDWKIQAQELTIFVEDRLLFESEVESDGYERVLRIAIPEQDDVVTILTEDIAEESVAVPGAFRKTTAVPRANNRVAVIVDVTTNDPDFDDDARGVILEFGTGSLGEYPNWVGLDPEEARRLAIALGQAADAMEGR